jgi:hypothetical protein
MKKMGGGKMQKMIQKMGGMQGAEGGLPDLSKMKLPPMGGGNKFPTSCGPVPEPLAIRFLREPLISLVCVRSLGVIELIIAKMIKKMGGMQGAEGGLPDLSKMKLPPMGGGNKFPF